MGQQCHFVLFCVILGNILQTISSISTEESLHAKTNVSIRVLSLEVEEIDSHKMEMAIRFEMEHLWTIAASEPEVTNASSVRLNKKSQGGLDLWPPEVQISNGREASISRTAQWHTNTSAGFRYTALDTVAVRVGCRLDFSMYPFDHQRCVVDLQKRSVQFIPWVNDNGENSHPGDVVSGIYVSPFSIVSITSAIESTHDRSVKSYTEKISKFVVYIHTRRNYGAYFTSYFLPISSFVFISLLTLWLVYPKISVIVNFMNIILVNIFLVIMRNHKDIPEVYYTTAMSVNSTTALIFIVLVLLVNVYVLYYIKCEEEDDEERARKRRAYDLNIRSDIKFIPPSLAHNFNRGSVDEGDMTPSRSNTGQAPSTWVVVKQKLMDRIRRNSHWTLLITYLLFLLVFWITMLSIHYLQ